MRNLLHEVLPPDIATKLFNGETVRQNYHLVIEMNLVIQVSPIYFDCVTIFFSDIVGFTNIKQPVKPF